MVTASLPEIDNVPSSQYHLARANRVRALGRLVRVELEARGQMFIARGRVRAVLRAKALEGGRWEVKKFKSVTEAARGSGIGRVGNISEAAKRGGTASGFRWAFADDVPGDFPKPSPGA